MATSKKPFVPFGKPKPGDKDAKKAPPFKKGK